MLVPSNGKVNTWALIDVLNMAHRALYSLGKLSGEELETGITFAFFEQLRITIRDGRVWTNKIALCFDSKISYREMAYPPYKKKRKENKTDDEIKQREIMDRQIGLLAKKYLPKIGFRMFRQAGLEADDIMAKIALKFRGRDNLRAIILTADGDLCQCITNNVHWYDTCRDNYLTPLTFQDKKGCKPNAYAMVKAIAGCATDNVEGVKGVGEKTAIEFIDGNLPISFKRYLAIISETGNAIMKRNIPLVKLPHAKTKPIKLRKPIYNPDAFFEMCEELGMYSYLEGKRKKEWENIFAGTFKPQATQRRRRRK